MCIPVQSLSLQNAIMQYFLLVTEPFPPLIFNAVISIEFDSEKVSYVIKLFIFIDHQGYYFIIRNSIFQRVLFQV